MEAEHQYELHTHVKENLMNEVHGNIKHWQRDNYHKVRDGRKAAGGGSVDGGK